MLQEGVDGLQLAEGTNATVVVNEYKEYIVEFYQDGYLNAYYIYPQFKVAEELFTADGLVNITFSSYYFDESLKIEGIKFIGGTTADTTTITFDAEELVTMAYLSELSGLIVSFDKNKAAGINLSAVEKVIITARSDYGYEQTFEVSIAQ
ncbi:MAG: hypothetical protein ABS949_17175 [Solibacillus sp.]